MFFIDTSRNGKPVYDPIVNQSLDNFLINDLRLKGHGLIMYINSPCVIIGANQNAYTEVNLDYMNKNGIKLVRRTGGGGAVYHDFGNIIFENIVVDESTRFGDFQYYADPIVHALEEMGLENVEMKGKNDVSVEGHKISGMSMVAGKDSIAAGGTLLYDLDHEQANNVLTPDQEKLKAKGVKSVNKRILNIKDLLPSKYQSLSTQEFKEELLLKIFDVDSFDKIEKYTLTEDDWKVIDSRIAEKFGTDAWNYGKNPGYDYYVSKYFNNIGTIAFNYNIDEQHIITDFKTYGDINYPDLTDLNNEMLGTAMKKEDLIEAFENINYQRFLGEVQVGELADLILNQ
ncbi:lipoate--protein ligase [Tetragenococcus osmophilus]|uniref:lipoate--protein ligase n=1 Tax=Tetragenococcus osmophilus TaxID=526944 RepID=A0AA37XLV6_9ENTE|nr:lipoate--protein ligase [Tetragenococcus osmophilus]AYW48073.1 lipoate--protein ligase [Tetragenococcus osmophilus]GMA53807.1 lipoate--protein ligase [Alicyclobacillus contaminans]GMA72269.1 lipoate--protein ligase [Tetragenococcus osmophilus]